MAVLGIFCSGCARVATTTTISQQGEIVRKAVYTIPNSTLALDSMGALPGVEDTTGKEPKPPTPADYFKIPEASGTVKVEPSDNPGEVKVTVTQTGTIDTLQNVGLTLWEKKGTPLVTSAMKVNKLENGNLEYVEVLHWAGKRESQQMHLDPELRAKVKAILPEEFRKTEVIDKVLLDVGLNLVYAVFGPPEPAIGNFFVDPDGSVRKVNTLLVPANAKTLRACLEGISEEKALELSRSLSKSLFVDPEKTVADKKGDNDSKDSGNGMSTLHFAVAFPGKVVETNGIIDPLDGHVYWSLMALAAEPKDIELRVVFQPGPTR